METSRRSLLKGLFGASLFGGGLKSVTAKENLPDAIPYRTGTGVASDISIDAISSKTDIVEKVFSTGNKYIDKAMGGGIRAGSISVIKSDKNASFVRQQLRLSDSVSRANTNYAWFGSDHGYGVLIGEKSLDALKQINESREKISTFNDLQYPFYITVNYFFRDLCSVVMQNNVGLLFFTGSDLSMGRDLYASFIISVKATNKWYIEKSRWYIEKNHYSFDPWL